MCCQGAMGAEHSGGLDSDDDRPDESAVNRLDGDSLAAILSSLDAFSLAMTLGVSKLWRTTALSEDLWAAACRARWQLPAPRGGKLPGRLPHIASLGRRCTSWAEAYRIFHRLKRPPLLHDRVAYATGMQDSVGCWLLVAHRPACKLPLALHRAQGASAHKVLRARVLVQNLRERGSVGLSDGCLQMTYRGIERPFAVRVASGEVVATSEQGKRPWAFGSQAKLESEAAVEAAEAAPCGGVPPPEVFACASSPLLLAPLQFALLDCELAALTGMELEPDVIEACDALQLRLSVPAAAGADHLFAEMSVACPFNQDNLFDHYQHINSGFWVHDAELDRDRQL